MAKKNKEGLMVGTHEGREGFGKIQGSRQLDRVTALEMGAEANLRSVRKRCHDGKSVRWDRGVSVPLGTVEWKRLMLVGIRNRRVLYRSYGETDKWERYC